MKSFNKLVVVFALLLGPFSLHSQEVEVEDTAGVRWVSYGDPHTAGDLQVAAADKSFTKADLEGDSSQLTLKVKVDEVCRVKGCWMAVSLDDGTTAMVTFKDYGFFVPTTLSEATAVVSGQAETVEVSVEEQQHYARDKGASQEEIDRITEPKLTYRLVADRVLVSGE